MDGMRRGWRSTLVAAALAGPLAAGALVPAGADPAPPSRVPTARVRPAGAAQVPVTSGTGTSTTGGSMEAAAPATAPSTSVAPSTVPPVPVAPTTVPTAPTTAGPTPTEPTPTHSTTTHSTTTHSTPAPSTTTGPTGTAGPAPHGWPGSWGLYAPDFPGSMGTVSGLQDRVGRRADYVMWYVHWAGPYSAYDAGDLAAVSANGSTPVITWMSDDPTGATTITDRAIAAGIYDGYIRDWAQGLASSGQRVLLRFDHEMNGNWYGWDPGVNANTAADYVAAWRHVHALFVAAGASNVTFVWAPNVAYPGSAPLADLYPGDGYVDEVGIDGYNWGPLDGHSWEEPDRLFGPTLQVLTGLSSRPLLITEVGCTPVGGDKAAWMTAFFAWLATSPAHGFIWFDANKETDWRVDSSPSALGAFAQGLTGRQPIS